MTGFHDIQNISSSQLVAVPPNNSALVSNVISSNANNNLVASYSTDLETSEEWYKDIKIFTERRSADIEFCIKFSKKLRTIYGNDLVGQRLDTVLIALSVNLQAAIDIRKNMPYYLRGFLLETVVRVSLVAIVANRMVANRVGALSLTHPLIVALTKLIEYSTGPLNIIKHHVWCVRDMLLAPSNAQVLSTGDHPFWSLLWAVTKLLLTVGVVLIPAAVSPSLTPAVIGTAVVAAIKALPEAKENLEKCWQQFKVAAHYLPAYHPYIHNSVTKITLKSSALNGADYEKIGGYLAMLDAHIEKNENYHGENNIIIKTIIDTLTRYLFWFAGSNNGLSILIISRLKSICEHCAKHLARVTMHIYNESYNEVFNHCLYNLLWLEGSVGSVDLRAHLLKTVAPYMAPGSQRYRAIRDIFSMVPEIKMFSLQD